MILGIDPGLTGALAVLNGHTGQLIDVADMPVRKQANGKNEIDSEALALWIDTNRSGIKYAVIEDVSSAPGQGVVSMFTFGKVTGIVLGILAAHYIPVYGIKPAVWKFSMGLTSDKKKSLKMAREQWPAFAHKFSQAKDDGRAEAALLGFFGMRFYDLVRLRKEGY